MVVINQEPGDIVAYEVPLLIKFSPLHFPPNGVLTRPFIVCHTCTEAENEGKMTQIRSDEKYVIIMIIGNRIMTTFVYIGKDRGFNWPLVERLCYK